MLRKTPKLWCFGRREVHPDEAMFENMLGLAVGELALCLTKDAASKFMQ